MAIMPDLTGMTEAEAQAALVAAGVPGTIQILAEGAVGDGWNDEIDLGLTPGPAGTIALQGFAAGDDITFLEPDGLIPVDVWGVDDRVTPMIFTTVADWASSPETTLYEAAPDPPHDFAVSQFRVEITSLHTPDGVGGTVAAEVLFEFEQFSALTVRIPINDARTAEVTVSMHDPILDVLNGGHDLLDFKQYLRIYYRDQPQPVFWGPLRTEDDYATGTIKITSIDALRLQRHFVRRGDDGALNDPDDPDLGTLTLDWRAIQNLLATAQNTDEQNARGVPVLGIAMGNSATNSAIEFQIQRGQNVWQTMQTVSGTAGGPDFELRPADDVDYVYAELMVYDTQGEDRGLDFDPDNGIIFSYGAPPESGYPDNLTNVRSSRLNPITHAHVLDDARESRVTAADADSSEDFGVYVEWVQSNLNLINADTSPLEEIAQAYVDAYGRPPHAMDLDMRPDSAQQWFYGEDFWVGDIVSVWAVRGYRGVVNTHMRVTSVTLAQPGHRGSQTSITVVPYVARTIIDEDS